MRKAVQRFADGVGILGYDDMDTVIATLPLVDRMQYQYRWANDWKRRLPCGLMPSIMQILGIVETARKNDHGVDVFEDFSFNSSWSLPAMLVSHRRVGLSISSRDKLSPLRSFSGHE